ncbi:hypothetical protein BC830DRAFT_1050137, partial [Chytriomyces sp. MP71]
MVVTVRTLGRGDVALSASSADTLPILKLRIAHALLIPADRQRLMFKGRELQDTSHATTLTELGLPTANAVVHLTLKLIFSLYVRLSPNTPLFHVPDLTPVDLCARIQESVYTAQGIPPALQRLVFKGVRMEADIRLGHYGLQDRDVVSIQLPL